MLCRHPLELGVGHFFLGISYICPYEYKRLETKEKRDIQFCWKGRIDALPVQPKADVC